MFKFNNKTKRIQELENNIKKLERTNEKLNEEVNKVNRILKYSEKGYFIPPLNPILSMYTNMDSSNYVYFYKNGEEYKIDGLNLKNITNIEFKGNNVYIESRLYDTFCKPNIYKYIIDLDSLNFVEIK